MPKRRPANRVAPLRRSTFALWPHKDSVLLLPRISIVLTPDRVRSINLRVTRFILSNVRLRILAQIGLVIDVFYLFLLVRPNSKRLLGEVQQQDVRVCPEEMLELWLRSINVTAKRILSVRSSNVNRAIDSVADLAPPLLRAYPPTSHTTAATCRCAINFRPCLPPRVPIKTAPTSEHTTVRNDSK